MSSDLTTSKCDETPVGTNDARPTMPAFVVALAALIFVLGACGSSEQAAGDSTPDEATLTDDDDHGDEDHDDEEHGDDHDGEEHGDEEHDDDGDKDHDAEHGDDHDDHDDEEGSSGLGAHEHGSADLSVAWIETDIVVDLISPTQNVFGFEYEPETDEDIALADERTEALAALSLVTFNDDAGCELTEPAATTIEQEGSHSEITVSWEFSCANPADVLAFDLTDLFSEFPGFELLDVEWVTATTQSSTEMSPNVPQLQLES